jgi:hypothetical protein
MRTWLQLAALCLLAAGCKVDVDFANTRFKCTDGTCPGGYQCVEDICVLEDDGGGGDDSDAAGGGAIDAAQALQACDDQFGAVAGYELCAENGDSCEFFHATGDGTQDLCTDVCETYASTCVESYDATAGATQCTRASAEEGCAIVHSSQICVCARSPVAN